MEPGLDKVMPRTNHCDLSLFHLGLRLHDHFLNKELSNPMAFTASSPWLEGVAKYVRQ